MKKTMFYALTVHLLLAGIGHPHFVLAAKGVTKRSTKHRAPRTRVNNSRNLGKSSSGKSSSSSSSSSWYNSQNFSNRNSNGSYNNGSGSGSSNSSSNYNSGGYNSGSSRSNYSASTSSGTNDSIFGFWGVTSLIVVGAVGVALAYLAAPQIMCSYKHEKVQAQKSHTPAPTAKPKVEVVGNLPGSSKYKAPKGSDFMTI